MHNAHRLKDKVAVITGASRGIGRAVATLYAREGATVVVNHYHDGEAAAATLEALARASAEGGHGSRPHRAIDADVGDAAAIEKMFAEVAATVGAFHILVNNAGFQLETPGESFDLKTFERILAVDLVGPALCARAALAHFLSRPGGGCIINTTSVHEIIPKPTFEAYSVAKGGLGNLTRTLALEFADRGIRVNAVGPGAVMTDMNAAWINDPKGRAVVESHIPMGRAAEAEADIAPVFVFLASEEARYITGQTIFACGGITLFADFQRNWAS